MTSSNVPKLRKALKRSSPGTTYEQQYWELGRTTVVGVDEGSEN